MIALAIPMSIFYVFSVVIGYIIQRHKRRAEAAAAAARLSVTTRPPSAPS